MSRTLAKLTDAELDARFLEAESHALLWTELGVAGSSERGTRRMQIAAELQAEILRRARAPKPPKSRRAR